MLLAVPRPAVAGIRGRRSAGLPFGAAAGWASGILGPGAGLLRRRRTSCHFALQALGHLRKGADSEGRSVPIESLDRSLRAGACAAAAQVRRQAPSLDPSTTSLAQTP